tara:strand:+ start:1203 stop:2486 length:1284 start_codon:yes stop_codon:yes gene_type:complete
MSREDAAIPAAQPVHFREAISFLRNKTRVPTGQWADLWRDEHTRGFMVAGAAKDQLIADFQGAILKAMQNGETLESFRRDFDQIVKKHGWSYNGSRGWRSKVIFETNLRQAYNAGRWVQAQRLKSRRPNLRYVSVQDERTRPHHRAWHGTILPVDHPWWDKHHPPNGWNCRCSVMSVSDREMKRRGWKISAPPPDILTRRRINTSAGARIVEAPAGIDSGFDYNPGLGAFGRARQASILKLEDHRTEEFFAPGYIPPGFNPDEPPAIEPRKPQRPLVDYLQQPTEPEMLKRLHDAIGGDHAVYLDPFGHRVAITDSIVTHWNNDPEKLRTRDAMFGQFEELIQSPSEIWLGFARRPDGKVILKRRYINVVTDAGNRPALIFIAEEREGFVGFHEVGLQGTTIIGGRVPSSLRLGKFRRGKLIYRREG